MRYGRTAGFAIVLSLLIAASTLSQDKALTGFAQAQREYYQADLLYRAGKMQDALKHVATAAKAAPEYLPAQHLYQDIRGAMGEREKCAEEYRERLKRNPQDAVANYLVGRITGDLKEKEDLFKKAIALDPKLAWAQYGLGYLYERQQKWPESEAAFKAAIALQPDSAEFHHGLGFCCMEQGRNDDAEKEYNAALKCDPNYADSYVNLSIIAMRRKDADAAVKFCEKALKADKDNPWAHNNFGKALFMQQRYSAALRHYQAAIATPRYDSAPQAYLNMGFAYRAQGKFEQAAAACRKAIELQPDFAYAHNCLAYVLFDQKKYDEAAAEAKKAKEMGYDVPERFLKALGR